MIENLLQKWGKATSKTMTKNP